MTQASAKEQTEGTCLVVGAALVFALVALVVKIDPLPVLVATECRFLVSWAIAVAFMLAYRVPWGLRWMGPPALRNWLILKCVMYFTYVILWWTALGYAPIGDCIAIMYTSPILISVLSRVFLGELLPAEFPFQVLLVVIGTILVLDPPIIHAFFMASSAPEVRQQDSNYTPVFLALFACAVVPLATKKTQDCSWIEVEHVSAFLASIVLTPTMLCGQYLLFGGIRGRSADPTSSSSVTVGEVVLISLAAAGSFVGLAMETKGYQLADVGKASMVRYVEVPFAYVLQRLGTTEPVEMQAVLGSVLILLSCLIGLRSKKEEEEKEAPLLGEE